MCYAKAPFPENRWQNEGGFSENIQIQFEKREFTFFAKTIQVIRKVKEQNCFFQKVLEKYLSTLFSISLYF